MKTYLRCAGKILIILGLVFLVPILNFSSSQDFSTSIPSIKWVIWLLSLILILVLIPKFRNYVSENEKIVNVILVIVTLIFTLSLYYIDKTITYRNTNNLLLVTTNVNYNLAKENIDNTYMGYLSWADFLISPYEQHISFVSKNFYPKSCADSNIRVIPKMQAYNSYNSYTNSLDKITVDITKKKIQTLNSIKSELKNIRETCFSIKE